MLEKRLMSAAPLPLPPVIHDVERQEFTLFIPGHPPAYLRYTMDGAKRQVEDLTNSRDISTT